MHTENEYPWGTGAMRESPRYVLWILEGQGGGGGGKERIGFVFKTSDWGGDQYLKLGSVVLWKNALVIVTNWALLRKELESTMLQPLQKTVWTSFLGCVWAGLRERLVPFSWAHEVTWKIRWFRVLSAPPHTGWQRPHLQGPCGSMYYVSGVRVGLVGAVLHSASRVAVRLELSSQSP